VRSSKRRKRAQAQEGAHAAAPQRWQRASDLEAAAIIARHSIPLIGVFALGWSPLEVIASLFLDSLSVLARAAGVGIYYNTSPFAYEDQGLIDRINLIIGSFVVFLVVFGLLAFALGVLGFFIWGYVLQPSGVDVSALVYDRSLAVGFGAMLTCQLPGLVQFIRAHDEESARTVVAPEVGFILRRVAVIAGACSVLGILPGDIALGAAIVLIQTVLAASEIYRGSQLFRVV
jgi:hypothetical protein